MQYNRMHMDNFHLVGTIKTENDETMKGRIYEKNTKPTDSEKSETEKQDSSSPNGYCQSTGRWSHERRCSELL